MCVLASSNAKKESRAVASADLVHPDNAILFGDKKKLSNYETHMESYKMLT